MTPTTPELGVCILAGIGFFALLYFADKLLKKYWFPWRRKI